MWQRSFALCMDVYRLTRRLPAEERFGLSAQLRRAAVSVPSNIAEGYNRGSRAEYLRFLWIAYGSTNELDTQILLARELGFLAPDEVEPVLAELGDIERMLNGLIRTLRSGAQS